MFVWFVFALERWKFEFKLPKLVAQGWLIGQIVFRGCARVSGANTAV